MHAPRRRRRRRAWRPYGAGAAVAASLLLASTAWAYRPFDQTDADVAEAHHVELEIGPVALQRSSEDLVVVAPSLIFNYGLAPRFELVVEGKNQRALGSTADHRWKPQDFAVSIKGLARRGSLQGDSGPSIALEPSVLLPGRDQSGVGGQVGLIVSTAGAAGALHLNVVPAVSRAHAAAGTVGVIAEGPLGWRVRPVAEGAYSKEAGLPGIGSALAGLIGRGGESWTFDAALRLALGSSSMIEARAGVTLSFGS